MTTWLNQQPFFIKLTNKEYWPIWATYFPVIFYYFYLSIRAKSLFFFTATNPGIEIGGMLGESKKLILDKISDKYKPASPFFAKNTSFEEILETLKKLQIDFPIVAKPDVGERGNLVEKLNTPEDLKKHIKKNNIDYIIQPFIDYEEELAIMFWRMPYEEKVKIYSVTRKQFLAFTGDGKHTLRELILASSRAILQYDKLVTRFDKIMDDILPKGKKIELEPIGNHCRGTMFLDGNNLIDNDLEQVISNIAMGMEEIYFGRFDLKCKSIEDLKKGENIAILELNGTGAEPAHIYDPNSNLLTVFKTLLGQWSIMFDIAMYNHKVRKIPFMTIKEIWIEWKKLNAYNKSLKL
jgi:hypothetical protein